MPKAFRLHKTIGESSIFVKTDRREAAEVAFQTIVESRKLLQDYGRSFPEFFLALDPVPVSRNAPEIVLRMTQAADAAKVGPMAAVAGALADLAVEEMIKGGAKIAVVEDGGEISVRSSEKLDVMIYAGESSLSKRLGFRILPEDCPLGLATSSGTVGHALSLGFADAATVVAENAALADAAATAVCNAVDSKDLVGSIERGLRVAQSIQGVKGALIIRENRVGFAGQLPGLIGVKQLQKTGRC